MSGQGGSGGKGVKHYTVNEIEDDSLESSVEQEHDSGPSICTAYISSDSGGTFFHQ